MSFKILGFAIVFETAPPSTPAVLDRVIKIAVFNNATGTVADQLQGILYFHNVPDLILAPSYNEQSKTIEVHYSRELFDDILGYLKGNSGLSCYYKQDILGRFGGVKTVTIPKP